MPPDDKMIRINYENSSKLEKIKMIETAETINDCFKHINFEELSSYVLLTYDDLRNRLQFVMQRDDGEYCSIFINSFTKMLDGVSTTDDIFSSLKGKRITIPLSLNCSYKDGNSIQNSLSEKQKNEAILSAKDLVSICEASYTKKPIRMKYTDEIEQMKKDLYGK